MEVPEPPEMSETLVELRLSRGSVGEHVAEIATVPAKPLMLERLIVTVPVLRGARVSELTLVLRLKSCTLTVITTECVNEPLVAETVTVYVPPVDELSVSVDVPVPPDERTRLVGESDVVRPEEVVAVRVTVPLNPPKLARLRVDVEDEPARKLTVVGEAAMV